MNQKRYGLEDGRRLTWEQLRGLSLGELRHYAGGDGKAASHNDAVIEALSGDQEFADFLEGAASRFAAQSKKRGSRVGVVNSRRIVVEFLAALTEYKQRAN